MLYLQLVFKTLPVKVSLIHLKSFQRGSYNQELNFTLRIGEHSPKPSADDVILEGAGLRVSRPIFGQRNALPSIQNQDYSFRLHEHPDFGWNPRLPSRDFMSILSNLTAIKIRGTFTSRGVGFLDNVKLETARRGAAGSPAPWIEMCSCPEGYFYDINTIKSASKYINKSNNTGNYIFEKVHWSILRILCSRIYT